MSKTTGVLLIHGFTGGSFELRPLQNFLSSRTDWKLVIPQLPGHGTSLSLRQTSAESWLMEAELALRKLRKEVDRVYVIGFSMGGLIALYLAMRYPIDKLVLLSAAAKYISPRILLEDATIMLKGSILKKYPPNTFYHLYNYKLTHTPIRAAIEFLRVVHLVKPFYEKIQVPVCLVQGKKDGIVPYSAAEELYERLGSQTKLLISSEMGKHHICYSDDCESWFEKVLRFLHQ